MLRTTAYSRTDACEDTHMHEAVQVMVSTKNKWSKWFGKGCTEWPPHSEAESRDRLTNT